MLPIIAMGKVPKHRGIHSCSWALFAWFYCFIVFFSFKIILRLIGTRTYCKDWAGAVFVLCDDGYLLVVPLNFLEAIHSLY